MSEVPDKGIRARAREVLRDELAETALRLFEERGFGQTTVDDIATEAGISPRTFYRYFSTKEDAILGDLPAAADTLREHLAQYIGEEPVWEALRRTMQVAVAHVEAHGDRWRRVNCIVKTSEALRARNFERHMHISETLIPLVTERTPAPPPAHDFKASVLVHAALMCFDAALASWAEHETQELAELLDLAFDAFPEGHAVERL